ncbi:Basic-leucine zipper domain [Dillenia turbinata]|uniref:Basic-leucine zipper domain n=1 Tax=Dillenia turbinata TaxID=194707 RepID=A0AAN8ZBA0_9MAGN
MDDGEVGLSDNVLLPNPSDGSSSFPCSAYVDSYLDEILKNTRTCTHTHTCNPPGPDLARTHTCYHTHTHVFASEEDNSPNGEKTKVSKSRRPLGNREAVRKYREKKKAHTAYLQEEVKKLHLLNQQLVRKLQGQAIIEAEVLRLRGLLVDVRAKIDNELGVYPLQKQCNTMSTFKEGDCGVQSTGGGNGLQCENDIAYFHPQSVSLLQGNGVGGIGKIVGSWEGYCLPAIVNCQTNADEMTSPEGHVLDVAEPSMHSLPLGE